MLQLLVTHGIAACAGILFAVAVVEARQARPQGLMLDITGILAAVVMIFAILM